MYIAKIKASSMWSLSAKPYSRLRVPWSLQTLENAGKLHETLEVHPSTIPHNVDQGTQKGPNRTKNRLGLDYSLSIRSNLVVC
jgi:hypothetical protein